MMRLRLLSFLAPFLVLSAPSRAQVTPFHPAKSVWSVHSSDEIPEGPAATAEELAPSLGLEPLGPDDQGFDLWRHTASGMLFVFVPGGMASIGSDHSVGQRVQGKMAVDVLPAEQPQVQVYVSPFFIGLYEVTNAQYAVFLEAWKRGEVDAFEYPYGAVDQDHQPLFPDAHDWGFREPQQPASGVHWVSAYAMSRWMGGRLPTECEWEKASRGTDGRHFPWGNEVDSSRANTNLSRNSRTTPVGIFPGGRSPYGCYDMVGNVTEYVMDPFEKDVYRYYPRKDPCLLFRNGREGRKTAISRGGCWNHLQGTHIYARCAARCREYPHRWIGGSVDPATLLWSGFRVVLSPQAELYPEGLLEKEWARVLALRSDRAANDESDGPAAAGPLQPEDG